MDNKVLIGAKYVVTFIEIIVAMDFKNVRWVINKLYESYPQGRSIREFDQILKTDTDEMDKIKRYLEHYNMIEPYGDFMSQLTHKTQVSIAEHGGVQEYFDYKAKEVDEKKERQRITDETAKIRLKNSKWFYKTRWWPLIISLGSIILALISILL